MRPIIYDCTSYNIEDGLEKALNFYYHLSKDFPIITSLILSPSAYCRYMNSRGSLIRRDILEDVRFIFLHVKQDFTKVTIKPEAGISEGTAYALSGDQVVMSIKVSS